ncbi:hypothetical protein D3C84_1206900 [compost metagenome]
MTTAHSLKSRFRGPTGVNEQPYAVFLLTQSHEVLHMLCADKTLVALCLDQHGNAIQCGAAIDTAIVRVTLVALDLHPLGRQGS